MDVDVWSRTNDVTIRHGGLVDGIFMTEWLEQPFGSDPTGFDVDIDLSLENMLNVDITYVEYFNDDSHLVGADMAFSITTSSAVGFSFDAEIQGNGDNMPVDLDLDISYGFSITNSQTEWRLEYPSPVYTSFSSGSDGVWDCNIDDDCGTIIGDFDSSIDYSFSVSGVPTEDFGFDDGEFDIEVSDMISKTDLEFDENIYDVYVEYYTGDSKVIDLGDGASTNVVECESCPPGNPLMFLMMREVITNSGQTFAEEIADEFADNLDGDLQDLLGLDNSDEINLGTNHEVNADGENYVAYAFASVQGFSKFGKYTGNNNADGPFVYTGFKPAFVLLKNTDASQNWFIYDNKDFGANTNTDATNNRPLFANEPTASSSVGSSDMDAGFSLAFTDGSKLDVLNAGNASGSHDISIPGSAGAEGVDTATSNAAETGLDFMTGASKQGIEYHTAADFLADGLKMSFSASTDGGEAAGATYRIDGHVAVGATYVTDLGDSAVTIGAGWSEVDGSKTSTAPSNDTGGFHVGLSAVTGDLTVAVGFADGDSLADTNDTQIDGEIMKAGVKYVSGDLTFNVGMTSSTAKDSTTIGTAGTTEDSYDKTSASVSYAVASGVTAIIGYSDVDSQNEGTNDGLGGSAWYIGANMSF